MMPAAHLAPPSPSQNSSGLQGPFLLSPETWSPSFARHSAESAEKSPEQAAWGVLLPEALEGVSWVRAHIPAEQSGASFRCA